MTGEDLKARRLALGMTQARLGDALGVPQPTIARWEAGMRMDNPRLLDLALDRITPRAGGPVIPAGPFEVSLFRRALDAAFAPWATLGAPIRAHIGPHQGDGTFLLTLGPAREFSWEDFFPPQVVGRCWLEAGDRDDPVAWYSVPHTDRCPAQANRVQAGAPYIDWGAP